MRRRREGKGDTYEKSKQNSVCNVDSLSRTTPVVTSIDIVVVAVVVVDVVVDNIAERVSHFIVIVVLKSCHTATDIGSSKDNINNKECNHNHGEDC